MTKMEVATGPLVATANKRAVSLLLGTQENVETLLAMLLLFKLQVPFCNLKKNKT